MDGFVSKDETVPHYYYLDEETHFEFIPYVTDSLEVNTSSFKGYKSDCQDVRICTDGYTLKDIECFQKKVHNLTFELWIPETIEQCDELIEDFQKIQNIMIEKSFDLVFKIGRSISWIKAREILSYLLPGLAQPQFDEHADYNLIIQGVTCDLYGDDKLLDEEDKVYYGILNSARKKKEFGERVLFNI